MADSEPEKEPLEGDMEKGTTSIPEAGPTGSLVSRVLAAKEWISQRRETVQPWGEFVNNKFARPKSTGAALSRLRTNLSRFQSNYMFVCLGLVAYCIVSSPLLLVAIAIIAVAHYYIGMRLAVQPIRLLGRDFTSADHALLTACIALPLLFLSSAGSVSLWVVGASVVLVSLHALCMPTADEGAPFDLEMEPV